MDTALGMYIYMCSSDKVIEHLLNEGIETEKQALQYLKPYVQSNAFSVLMSGGGGCLSGTQSCIKRVSEYFINKEKSGVYEKAKNFVCKITSKLEVADYKELAKVGIAEFIKQFGYPAADIQKLTEKELEKLHDIIIKEGL